MNWKAYPGRISVTWFAGSGKITHLGHKQTFAVNYGGQLNRALFKTMSQLPNYLRSHRKQLAFSQEDVAFLLGNQSGAKMCRYERFVREPTLEVAVALSVIMGKPLEEVFAGTYRRVELQVAARAKALGYRLDRRKPGQLSKRRREALQELSALAKVKR